MRMIAAALTVLGLAGCQAPVTPESLSYHSLSDQTRRAFAASYLDQPFADGAVHVVAEEQGEMKTFLLVPCRGGDRICAESLHGRAGHRTTLPDHVAVTGAYADRTFYLAPGGGGTLLRHGVAVPLAWE